MIEFQLTVYMCSYCTRVHNASDDCLHHEEAEHSTNSTMETADPPSLDRMDHNPFGIADDAGGGIGVDVKPNMTDEPSDMQRNVMDGDDDSVNLIEDDAGDEDYTEEKEKKRFSTGLKSQTQNAKQHECKPCRRSFSSFTHYYQHIRTSTAHKKSSQTKSTEKYYCRRCNYRTDRVLDYHHHLAAQSHKTIHEGVNEVNRYNCSRCKYYTDSQSNYRRHLGTLAHRTVCGVGNAGELPAAHKSPNRKYRFNCGKCDYHTDSESDYRRHLSRLVHIERIGSNLRYSFNCNPCNYHTNRPSDYRKHLTAFSHRSRVTSSSSAPIADRVVSTAVHDEENQCEDMVVNLEEVDDENELLAEYKRSLPIKPMKSKSFRRNQHSCVPCGVKFSTLTNYHRHMRNTIAHRSEVVTQPQGDPSVPRVYKYNCTQCNYHTDNEKYYKAHLRTKMHKQRIQGNYHTVTAKRTIRRTFYNCIRCDYHSDSASNYRRHLAGRVHLGIQKPLKRVIPKLEIVPDGEAGPSSPKKKRKYNCTICNYHTDQIYHYHRHLSCQTHIRFANKTPQEPHVYKFDCDECGFHTDNPAGYRKHLGTPTHHSRIKLLLQQFV